MESLFITLSFIGVYAAGFFSCLLLTIALLMLRYREADKIRKHKERMAKENGENKRTEHRSGNLQ